MKTRVLFDCPEDLDPASLPAGLLIVPRKGERVMLRMADFTTHEWQVVDVQWNLCWADPVVRIVLSDP